MKKFAVWKPRITAPERIQPMTMPSTAGEKPSFSGSSDAEIQIARTLTNETRARVGPALRLHEVYSINSRNAHARSLPCATRCHCVTPRSEPPAAAAGRDVMAAFVKMIAQVAEQLEAIGINPEGHRRQIRIEIVHELSELGFFAQRLLLGFAAIVRDRLDRPLAEAIAKTRYGRRRTGVERRPLPVLNDKMQSSRRRRRLPFHAKPVPQFRRILVHREIDFLSKGRQVDVRHAAIAALEIHFLGLHDLADRRVVFQLLFRDRRLVELLDLIEQLARAWRISSTERLT